MYTNRVKIVATIGPASSSPEVLESLIKHGMNIARLNFSHGTQGEKEKTIQTIRQISTRLDKHIGIIADLQGPKMRLGAIDGTVTIQEREEIVLSLHPKEKELPLVTDITNDVQVGEKIFLNDGLVELEITALEPGKIRTKALNDGWVTSHKGINLPDSILSTGALTEKDKADALFALSQGVDYLALSFVQSAEDVHALRKIIEEQKSQTGIIVKIERKGAVKSLSSIIEASDGVMVARGDLAIETRASQVPLIQEKIITIARQHAKPVIVATQMLASMAQNPRPTRAETSDVANAVLGQVDAVMLSEESASGKYPIEAVSTMYTIIQSVEINPEYEKYIQTNWQLTHKENIQYSAIASSAVTLAQKIHAKAIIVASATGSTVAMVSSFRPLPKIIATVYNDITARKIALMWSVHPIVIGQMHDLNTLIEKAAGHEQLRRFISSGDHIVVITGATPGTAGGTNTIKVVTI